MKKRGYSSKRLNLNLFFVSAVFFAKNDPIGFLLILHQADPVL
ncbi:hypothetical protein P872_02310 [Rhodonellum psychrophilum GCM71 = DSM 17998]|uniref:Uncharacterized protein n=1 Tax=Rhodonellum psychrophilum GCM71 = DSM 17998 TaxID=1123057 RepID=U5C1F4_9BACT|nr:hypothetical protein P872_02310 [Rhodonellum psychrophilum GCM71 = DSM 17998]